MNYVEDKDVSLKWLRAYYITGDDKCNNSIFAKILQMAEEGKKTFPFTDGKNKYDFIDVDELAKQISLASIQAKVSGIINVCSGEPISLKDKVELFIKEKGIDIQPEYGVYPSRKYDSPIIYGNPNLIKLILKEV
jgi:dTDP-6-deoxy-L-talose 4-dehydrogenase (NAD+)